MRRAVISEVQGSRSSPKRCTHSQTWTCCGLRVANHVSVALVVVLHLAHQADTYVGKAELVNTVDASPLRSSGLCGVQEVGCSRVDGCEVLNTTREEFTCDTAGAE